jgi:dTDP-L-rhamnose 4-epimerase
MRVLVTGGAGFIGGHVVAALRAEGHEVRVLDAYLPAAHRDPDAATDATRGDAIRADAVRAEVIRADVRDAPAVRQALRGVDAVVHHAAMVGLGVDIADLPDYVGCNDLGTAVLLAGMAANGIGRLVLASSMVVYGEGAYTCPAHGPVRPGDRSVADLAAGRFEPTCPRCGLPVESCRVDEDAPLAPRSVYAATKVAQEHLAYAWARTTGAAVTALRYHNVYGPGMPRDTPYSGVAAIFRSALAAGRPPRVFEDGCQRRDFVHVADVAAANVKALSDDEHGFRAYNIASGTTTTVGDLARALAAEMAGPAPVVTGQYRAGDVRHVVASPARAARELGFTARISLADGIAEFATASLRG